MGRKAKLDANQRIPLWQSIVVTKFFAEVDEEDGRGAARVKASVCPHCQGPFDRADYPRKPRRGDLAPAGERL